MIEEYDGFERLVKGNRVRKYSDASHINYKDGTIIKGAYNDSFCYVQWDGEKILDMGVSLYDVVKLINK